MANCGYTAESGEEAIASGAADLVAYGRPWISNPDLPRRFAEGRPLNPDAPMGVWYTEGADGYTTFPTVDEASGKAEAKGEAGGKGGAEAEAAGEAK